MKSWMDGNNRRLDKRETWNSREWVVTIALCVLFPPIGIAALLRRLFYRRVWH